MENEKLQSALDEMRQERDKAVRQKEIAELRATVAVARSQTKLDEVIQVRCRIDEVERDKVFCTGLVRGMGLPIVLPKKLLKGCHVAEGSEFTWMIGPGPVKAEDLRPIVVPRPTLEEVDEYEREHRAYLKRLEDRKRRRGSAEAQDR
jgi:hypothetical protein